MKKIKQMFLNKQFWIFAIITSLFFGTLLKLDFATDTYEVFEKSGKEMLMHFISSGRFLTGIAYVSAKMLNLDNNIAYMLSFILAIFSITVSTYKLNKIFSKDIKNNTISSLVSILIIINVFSIELFLYIEKGILCLSVLFCVLAVEKLIEYFESKEKKDLLFTFIYMLLANFSYQGTVALFVALALIYILKYSENFKRFVVNNIVTGLCYGIPAVINLVIVRVFENDRIAGEHNIKHSLIKIIDGTKCMLKTYEIIPEYIFKLILVLVIAILIYYIIKDKNKKIISVLSIIYIIIGVLFITILPQFMQATSSIWFVPRSSYAFGAIFAILILYLLINYKISIKLPNVIIMVSVLYLIVQYSGFQTIIRDHYIMNYMDEYFANQIKEKIEIYENETGNRVNKVAFYQKEIHWSYPRLKTVGDINVRAMAPEWSRISSLTYYLNREFEEIKPNDEIYNKFIKCENEEYIMDQSYIENDILNIFIY